MSILALKLLKILENANDNKDANVECEYSLTRQENGHIKMQSAEGEKRWAITFDWSRHDFAMFRMILVCCQL